MPEPGADISDLAGVCPGPSLASLRLWVGPPKTRPSQAALKATLATHPPPSSYTPHLALLHVPAARPIREHPQQDPTLCWFPQAPPRLPKGSDKMPQLLWL